MDKLKYYVDVFNSNDEEVYKNDIDNAHAYEWLKNEIPLFECPDEDVERAYYFRFWTFRKHIKSTSEGYVVTEFLPKVNWSGKYNVINAPNGHHLYEGRWLKNADKYLSEYFNYFFENEASSHSYSTWLIDAIYALSQRTGNFSYGENFLDKICAYYEKWENTHQTKNGEFWSIDDRDAMEFSISGRDKNLKPRRGVRPTLNSYMCADALAISKFAKMQGREDIATKYLEKHEKLKKLINEKLWSDGFYRAFHYEDENNIFDKTNNEDVLEEIGYIPWFFNIPPKNREDVFALLLDEKHFYTPYGIASADISHPRFLYEKDHECLWNGYVWPYATSQTLTALKNVIKNYGRTDFEDTYTRLLIQYAKNHYRIREEDGKKIDWIDEVRHPLLDEWSSREILKNLGWREDKGGYERGKDYNHSTFCDLIISGLVGVDTSKDEFTVSPIIPKDWDWFALYNVPFRGKTYSVIYDKYGTKFNKGKGIIISEDK